MAESLNQQASDMTLYWQLYQLQIYLERIQKNLLLINSVPNARIVNIIGGNLYQLASQYYGDASQWVIIAEANNIVDPMLVGVNSILIPPLNNQDSGGVYLSA